MTWEKLFDAIVTVLVDYWWYWLIILVLLCILRGINKKRKKQSDETAKKPSKVLKIVAVVIRLVAIALIVVMLFSVVSNFSPTPPGPSIEKLDAPVNVVYDEKTTMLSWDSVDNATGYAVSYNDNTYQVSETTMHILPTAEQNVFKVKAVGDGIDYSDSDWSQECIYTITVTTINVFEKVNLQLAKTASENGLTLVRVVGISETDLDATYGVHLSFETVCNDGKDNVNATISYAFDNLDDINEMINSISLYTESVVVERDIVDYNSAEELLLSNSFDGKMEEMRKAGYTFTVVDSCVRKGSKSGSSFTFSLVGTFKAEKDGDVRYFTSVNQIKIHNDQRDEPTNYEIALGYWNYRTVTESYFVEHTHGPTWEYMQGLVGASDTENL